ncbi:unnamed protein product [Closterium sp. NIES-54]
MAAIAGCAVPCVTGLSLTPIPQDFSESSVQLLRNVTASALPAVTKLTINDVGARVVFSRRLSRSLRVSPSLSGVSTAPPRGSSRTTRAMAGTSPGSNQSGGRDGSSASDLSSVCVHLSVPFITQPPDDGSWQVGCGGLCIDYLATVTAFPHPDDKIRSTSFEVQGGGNVGNTLTAISRLGLSTRIFTKAPTSPPPTTAPRPRVFLLPLYLNSSSFPPPIPPHTTSEPVRPERQLADDLVGKAMIAELQADGVDTSHIIVSPCHVSRCELHIVASATSVGASSRGACLHPHTSLWTNRRQCLPALFLASIISPFLHLAFTLSTFISISRLFVS